MLVLVKSAIFFERDGILNEVEINRNQQVVPTTLAAFKVKPEVPELLKKLKDAGFLLIVTTNQSGVSHGTLSRRELDHMHEILRRRAPVDDIFLCAHAEADHCPCRKPKPGLFTEAAFKYQLSLEHCFVVSDKWQDAEAAQNVGATSLLLKSPWNGKSHHDFVLPTLEATVDKLLSLRRLRTESRRTHAA
jgi:D-glycero-D-manno-heptose 1,7-bisphosphate phosphatase